jgi:tRNA A-37 threonylcarbamoyl transferase component Bud32
VDVGAFTPTGNLKSVGDCNEFFIVTEKAEGKPYHMDLDRIREEKRLTPLDEERCIALAEYLAEIHRTKKDVPQYYFRRIRDLLGHGEGIMGLTDNYPLNLDYISKEELCQIEKKCVEWRWKLKAKAHRCAQIHGDYHPWNILFRQDVDFSVLDRSRGEWGEPADDTSALSINYIFYALQVYGDLRGPFEKLFNLFWNTYLTKTGDEEMLTAIQPFYAWRGLVIASPTWYPNLALDVRIKLFNFIKNMLQTEEFDVKNVKPYLKS